MQPKKEKLPQSTLSRSSRSSARTAHRTAAMDGALSQLRAKRLKQQDSKAQGALRGSAKGIKQKAPLSVSLSSSSERGRLSKYHTEDEASIGGGKMADSDNEGDSPGS